MRCFLVAGFFVGMLVVGPAISVAATLSISDGPHSFDYFSDDTGTDGNISLFVGGIDVGYGDSWFYSTGGTATELLGGTVTSTGPDTAVIDFTIGSVDISISYQIVNVSPDRAELIKSATVVYNASAAISGKLANYVDYDIAGSTDDELVSVIESTNQVVINVAGPSFGGYEINYFDSLDRWELDEYDLLYDKLVTGADLDNTDYGFTIGDVTLAGEADFEAIAFELTEVMTVTTLITVPEPGSGALCVMASVVTAPQVAT